MTTAAHLIGTAEAARRLGLRLRTVQRLIAAGDLPYAAQVGGRYLLDPNAVDAYRAIGHVPARLASAAS